jgi:formylglycine-generating enzyme
MKRIFVGIIASAVVACAGIAQAQHAPWPADWNNWNDPALWATVGNAGNTGELSGSGAGGYGPDRICGSVNYAYNIGKFEVTAGQYAAFLNAKAAFGDPYGLYNTSMTGTQYGCQIYRGSSSDGGIPYTYSVAEEYANRPVNYVSFWDAARFTNWLNNGQGNGDTETGAYTLNFYNSPDGRTISRNIGATYFLPSEDEWYKAAYYDPSLSGNLGGYWDYPTRSNIAPNNRLFNPDRSNSANFSHNGYAIGGPYWRTLVGDYENSSSAYGTFDQGGNVFEWNEGIVYLEDTSSTRGVRGGSWISNSNNLLSSARDIYGYGTTYERNNLGFRVAMVPEPGSIVLIIAGALCQLVYAWRRRK